MKNWMSGIKGAVVIVMLWVIGWGQGFGGIMELVDPDGKIQDVWPTLLAIPGLIGGIIFAGLITVFERGRRVDEISFPRIALWGGVAGIVIGLLTIPAEVGDVSPGAAGMTGIATVLGLVAGFGTGVLFRLLTWWQTSQSST